jgi:hypothetical protein
MSSHKKSIKKHIPTYSKVAVILTNTIVLFILLNLIAHFVPSPLLKKQEEGMIIKPKDLLQQNPTLLQHIHEGKSTQDIATLYLQAPNVKSHPTLEFMTIPTSSTFYHVGIENCRYNSFVTNSNIKQRINNSTWLLGGSTTFGYGVADDETVAFFLNQLDTSNTYINFGAPSFHQKMEIEKLVLMLQKGYRPKHVIFLDGLNDLFKLTESNYSPFETPNKPINAYSNDFSLGSITINKNLFYALPVLKRYYEFLAYRMVKKGNITPEMLNNIYESNSLYNTQPFLHYHLCEVLLEQPKNTTVTSDKILNYYKENLTLLDALSKAYHFEYTVFMQPIGLFLPTNSFVKDTSVIKKSFRFYKNIAPAYQRIVEEVTQQKLPHFYDLSYAHELCPHPYVDLTHYSKSMNKKLAELILQKTTLPGGKN